MDHYMSRATTTQGTAAVSSPAGGQHRPAPGVGRCRVASTAGSPRRTVRRRSLSAELVPDQSADAPPASSPRSPPPAETTVRTVVYLRDSLRWVVRRRLLRPPGYTRPCLGAVQPPANERSSSLLPNKYEDMFWSLVGGGDRGVRVASHPSRRSSLLYALKLLDTWLSGDACPSKAVFTFLVHNVMAVGDHEVRHRCLRLLRLMTFLHPPHGRQMRNFYHDALAGEGSVWQLLMEAVERCLSDDRTSAPAGGAVNGSADVGKEAQEQLLNAEFLDLLVALLEEDIGEFSKRLVSAQDLLGQPAAWPLLGRTLWKSYQALGTPGAATASLCRWLVAAHAQSAAADDMTTRRLLLRLLAMTADLTRMSGQVSFLDVTGNMRQLAMQLCHAVQDRQLGAAALEDLLCSLRPAWLCSWLAVGLLEQRHDGPPLDRLSLAQIATSYLSDRRNGGTDGTDNGGPPADRRPSSSSTSAAAAAPRSPAASAAKRQRIDVSRTGRQGEAGTADGQLDQRPAGAAGRGALHAAAAAGGALLRPETPGALREYTMLLYHLLASHLLHTGLTEARLLLHRRLVGGEPLRDASLPATIRRHFTVELPVQYRRELDWIQDKFWQGHAAAGLHVRFALYMRTITKL